MLTGGGLGLGRVGSHKGHDRLSVQRGGGEMWGSVDSQNRSDDASETYSFENFRVLFGPVKLTIEFV